MMIHSTPTRSVIRRGALIAIAAGLPIVAEEALATAIGDHVAAMILIAIGLVAGTSLIAPLLHEPHGAR